MSRSHVRQSVLVGVVVSSMALTPSTHAGLLKKVTHAVSSAARSAGGFIENKVDQVNSTVEKVGGRIPGAIIKTIDAPEKAVATAMQQPNVKNIATAASPTVAWSIEGAKQSGVPQFINNTGKVPPEARETLGNMRDNADQIRANTDEAKADIHGVTVDARNLLQQLSKAVMIIVCCIGAIAIAVIVRRPGVA